MGSNSFVVIMAGGSGTRFWPASTSKKPKQLLALTGTQKTMLQESLQRALDIVPPNRILVIANKDFCDEVESQCADFFEKGVRAIYEPDRRDTAAAAILGAIYGRNLFGNSAKMITLTADHYITTNTTSLKDDINSALAEVSRDPSCIITFGINPTYASTGYGYLQIAESDGNISYPLSCFIEKPPKDKAEELLTQGCLWNSGMFIWQVDTFLSISEKHCPNHVDLLNTSSIENGELKINCNYSQIPKISLDHGIITFTPNVRAIKAGFNWSDLGGFAAIEELLEKDIFNNSFNTLVSTLESQGNLIYSTTGNDYVAIFGVDDLAIIRAEGKTLITKKTKLEELKRLLEKVPPEQK